MTKKNELQQKLNDVYAYLSETVEKRGYPPTVREVKDTFGWSSTASVHYYYKKLAENGLIKLDPNKSRSIELMASETPKAKDFVKVPLIGNIAAGQPILAIEEYEDYYSLPKNLFSKTGKLFMLTVEGSSMIEAGILDGDRIIVRQQNTAENGQIVAALIDGESATVKRFYFEKGKVRLHPENSTMNDFYPNDIRILGIVIGLIRNDIY